jgi:phage-related protein
VGGIVDVFESVVDAVVDTAESVADAVVDVADTVADTVIDVADTVIDAADTVIPPSIINIQIKTGSIHRVIATIHLDTATPQP